MSPRPFRPLSSYAISGTADMVIALALPGTVAELRTARSWAPRTR